MAAYEWQSRTRDYEKEKKDPPLAREEITEHPLKPVFTVTESRMLKKRGGSGTSSSASSAPGTPRKSVPNISMAESLATILDGTDPLSRFSVETDPLSRMAAEYTNQEKEQFGKKSAVKTTELDETFEPWLVKKSGILSKYTTSEKLSITTSFLSGGEKVVIKTQNPLADKVKTRLEQLDDFEEGSVKEMLNLSQQEYVHRIEELNQALIAAWNQDQRVKALKIVIQCAKLLADTSVIQFYPSKFVLITDILDTFGNLVFSRIRNKAEYFTPGSKTPTKLPENFTPEMVPESAKETCRNWFFKIASIRELIPRLYVETSILKSYSFLTLGEFSQALMRLTKMIRGIGDPLVAAFARCYLARVGMSVAPDVRDYLYENFCDFLLTYNQLKGEHVQSEINQQKVSFSTYMTLYSPALDWILQCIAYQAPEKLLTEILDKCGQQCSSALLLNSIMTAFKPEYIANRALQFVEMMKECQLSGFPKHLLFRTLGLCLVVADPPEDYRLQILREVWKIVTKFKVPTEYMICAEVWVEYPVKHFTKREVNTVLGDVIQHMTPDRVFENHYSQLHSIVDKILSHMTDFSTLFSMDKFLPFLDMFQKDSVKVEVCKLVTEAFAKYQIEPIHDPVIVNALMFICKTMHDSVNALTLEDEKRQIGFYICNFLRKVSFGRDFEQQLNFYMEARAAFTNLDSVMIQLVHSVTKIAMDTRNVVNGHHTRKTASFVRACAAYSFITIPSLMNLFHQLDLYLLTGQAALLNQCLGQADACFKAAISLIPDIPKTFEIEGKQKSTEPFLISYICNFLSMLLVVPDPPEHGVFYLLRGLLNVLQNYVWDTNSDARVIVYLNVLGMLSAASQETYPYHIEKVDSNDTLYGNDPKFLAEIQQICQTLMTEILGHLKILGDNDQSKRQSTLALQLFNSVIAHADLTNETLRTLTVNLWTLAHKHGHIDTRLSARTIEAVTLTGQTNKSFLDLASRL